MLKHAKGNLIDMAENGDFDIIVHGCNCQNTMGSGIAKEIRERYPQAYSADNCYFAEPVNKLHNFSSFYTGKFLIINAYTQLNFMPRGVDHFHYESFETILKKIVLLYGDRRIGFPYIGMGLAGGNGFRIQNMLEAFTAKIEEKGGTVTLVEFNG